MSEPSEPRAADPATEGESEPLLVVHDEAVSFEQTPVEGWIGLGIFWLLGLTVLYQFFTRYALNDSAAWTEEIARYLLIGTVFVGAAAAVRSEDHIRVDLLYRYLPRSTGAALALVVDVLSVLFYAALFLLSLQMMQKLGDYRMTVLDLPMNVVYGVCSLAFATMAVRAGLILRRHLSDGKAAPQD
jgi:TRAP-type C4-dicarboxylate transport system permease small subunit